jgi:16S rRNA (guanine527-N7)-methyltransferase
VSETHATFDWAARIRERAASCGIDLDDPLPGFLAAHVVSVLRVNTELHLTTITEPDEYLERHLGESFEGAAMVDPDATGQVLDIGSGNGYPGLPLAAARPRLQVTLAEASRRKGAFLRQFLRESTAVNVSVLEVQVQRPGDLDGFGPFRLVTSRAMGGWTKILPRLAPMLEPGGEMLVWAGDEVETIAKRAVWRRLVPVDRRPLPGRKQSWIWRFRSAAS